MSNRFRDPMMRGLYDNMVRNYREKKSVLFHRDGNRNNLNSWATHFWWGFDGVAIERWDREGKSTLAWACVRAGQDMSKEQKVKDNE